MLIENLIQNVRIICEDRRHIIPELTRLGIICSRIRNRVPVDDAIQAFARAIVYGRLQMVVHQVRWIREKGLHAHTDANDPRIPSVGFGRYLVDHELIPGARRIHVGHMDHRDAAQDNDVSVWVLEILSVNVERWSGRVHKKPIGGD